MNVKASPKIGRLVVIGLGLIGGSLAVAARERGLCEEVVGIVRSESTVQKAKQLGVVDNAYLSLADLPYALTERDIIFIAVPTLSVRAILDDIKRFVEGSPSITDGASVKGSVHQDVLAVYGYMPPHVVLGHPIAGSEKSGVEASNPKLYVNHRVILTPTDETDAYHQERVKKLWQDVGAEVLELSVKDHDDILAATSHLPHAMAFSLVDTLAHDSHNEDIFRYAAGGFRDFTRIASSDAVMWRDIMLANQTSVVKALDLFMANVQRLRHAIEAGDGDALLNTFTRAKQARDHFSRMLDLRKGVKNEQE